jgi:hypothetical protein
LASGTYHITMRMSVLGRRALLIIRAIPVHFLLQRLRMNIKECVCVSVAAQGSKEQLLTSGACCIGPAPIPDGPGRSLLSGLCRVPRSRSDDALPIRLLEYRDDCISANEEVELTDDDIEFCKSDELRVILRPASGVRMREREREGIKSAGIITVIRGVVVVVVNAYQLRSSSADSRRHRHRRRPPSTRRSGADDACDGDR